jgi:hypothetical protein
MTAKEELRQTVEDLSEAEAQDALGFIVRRRGQRDALGELLERAPVDDEPATPDEDQGVNEARAEIERGDVLSADEIRREEGSHVVPVSPSRPPRPRDSSSVLGPDKHAVATAHGKASLQADALPCECSADGEVSIHLQ